MRSGLLAGEHVALGDIGAERARGIEAEAVELLSPHEYEPIFVRADEFVVSELAFQSLGDVVAIDVTARGHVEDVTLAHFLEHGDIDAGLHRPSDAVHALGPECLFEGLPSRHGGVGVVGEGALGLQVGGLEIGVGSKSAQEGDQVEGELGRIDGAPAGPGKVLVGGVDRRTLARETGNPAADAVGQDRAPVGQTVLKDADPVREGGVGDRASDRGHGRIGNRARLEVFDAELGVEGLPFAAGPPDDDAVMGKGARKGLGEAWERLGGPGGRRGGSNAGLGPVASPVLVAAGPKVGLDRGGILDLEDDRGYAVDAVGGARVNAEVLTGEEEGVGEGVVLAFYVEFEITAFEADPQIVLVDLIPAAEIDLEGVGEGVGGVGGVAMRAEEDGGREEPSPLNELHG